MIRPINDYIAVELVDPNPDQLIKVVEMHDSRRMGKVLAVNKKSTLKPGQMVEIQPNRGEPKVIDGQEIFMVREDKIFGVYSD